MNEDYSKIESASLDEVREVFVTILKSYLDALEGDLATALQASYQIAGLMATDYARTLKDADPIDKILTIAGELEVNPSNAEDLRQELIQKINLL